MTTAPSDMRKATGMLPWAGGLSAFCAGNRLSALVAAVDAALAGRRLTAEKGIAAANPRADGRSVGCRSEHGVVAQRPPAANKTARGDRV
jgi:hypothetical protein